MRYNRILVVSNMFPSRRYPSYGVFVKNFCNQLEEIGIQYDISALTKTQNKAIKLMKYVKFYIFTFFKSYMGHYDLVYIHYPSFSARPVLFARKLRGFDVYSNVHGTDVIPLKKEHERMIVNTIKSIEISSKVIVPSEYYKQLLFDQFKVTSDKIVVYPSAGINDDVFFEYPTDKKEKLRKAYDIPDRSLVIGFVGRINRAKGWDVFLRAVETSSWMNEKTTKIFIVGSGEDDEELSERIRILPHRMQESIVRFPLLPQDKLAEIYNLLDIFVFPTMSASESLGLVAIEAMACGVPVIASDYAAPAFYVIDGVNGYKFSKGNVDALNQAIEYVVHDSEMNNRILKQGAIDTAKHFSKTAIMSSLKELFS